jgi:hypothetical protein
MLSAAIRCAVHGSTVLLLTTLAPGCRSDREAAVSASPSEETTALQIPTGHFAGTVTETMDAGTYTYVKLEKNGELVWAAGPQTAVAVGDELAVELAMPMPDFESPTIGRKFDTLYFVTAFGDPNGVPADPHAGIPGFGAGRRGEGTGDPAAGRPAVDPVEKPTGGYRIADVWARRKELAGGNVAVRGKVVKYNANILGVNWVHIQDGSGDAMAGTHDLTVTTSDKVALGDIVTVRGRLATDQDFGAGYTYELLIEKAKVTSE